MPEAMACNSARSANGTFHATIPFFPRLHKHTPAPCGNNCGRGIMARALTAIPEKQRPREKIRARGASHLSNTELFALMLGSGMKGRDVMTIASDAVKTLAENSDEVTVQSLAGISGIGIAKAAQIVASFEFARRRMQPDEQKVHSVSDVLPLIAAYADKKQEYFLCISLNGAHEVIKARVVSVGLVNKTQIHPREVFADPITDRATSIIVAHNHPSGETKPSREDMEVTRVLKEAAGILGINLLDHVIVSKKGYYSFQEEGKLSSQ